MNIPLALDQLADLRAAADALALQRQELIDSLIPDDIKAKIADIEAEFAGKADEAQAKAAELEAVIKQAVIEGGATVKGMFLMATWNKPRVTWDAGLLDGLALAFPQLKAARKEGEPTCTLRGVK